MSQIQMPHLTFAVSGINVTITFFNLRIHTQLPNNNSWLPRQETKMVFFFLSFFFHIELFQNIS